MAALQCGRNDKLEKRRGWGGLKEPQINKVMSSKEKGKEQQINKVISGKVRGKRRQISKVVIDGEKCKERQIGRENLRG